MSAAGRSGLQRAAHTTQPLLSARANDASGCPPGWAVAEGSDGPLTWSPKPAGCFAKALLADGALVHPCTASTPAGCDTWHWVPEKVSATWHTHGPRTVRAMRAQRPASPRYYSVLQAGYSTEGTEALLLALQHSEEPLLLLRTPKAEADYGSIHDALRAVMSKATGRQFLGVGT